MSKSSLTSDTKVRALFGNNVTAEAVVKKLTRDRNSINTHDNDDYLQVSPMSLSRIAQGTTQSMNDIENIFEVMPETELAMQILVSSIMSPNDMRAPELTWSATNAKVTPEKAAKMIKSLKTYFEGTYNIKGKLQDMLEQSLFITGSYPLMIVPENALDTIINSKTSISTEAIRTILDDNQVCKSMGILGRGATNKETTTRKAGIENFLDMSTMPEVSSTSPADKNVFVTDNYSSVRLPAAVAKLRRTKLGSVLGGVVGNTKLGIESSDISLSQISSMFYERKKDSQANTVAIPTVDTAVGAPVGHPMELRPPSDSIIPVHVPGNPEDHLGYYVLLDQFGNPISNARDSNYYKELESNRASISKTTSGNILSHMNQSMMPSSSPVTAESVTEMQEVYSRAMEKDLLERLRNGVYGNNVEISNSNEIYRIMLSRTLANKNTQVLYVPAELMTYVAFDYNRMGIGRSLIDKSKMLSSIRAILLFSNTMAAIKNSTNSSRLNIDLDPEDMESDSTVEQIMTSHAQLEAGGLPLASTNPMDIIDGIRRAATQVVVTGNPNWPETKVSMESLRKDHVVVDSVLDEQIRDRLLMSWGVTPELVDSSATIDFAIEAVHRNLLFNKRLSMYQDKTEVFLSEHVVRYSLNSGTLMKELIETVIANSERGEDVAASTAEELGLTNSDDDENTDDLTAMELVVDFLDNLHIDLPAPDNTKVANQLEQLELYDRALTAVLPSYISEDMLRETIGEGEGSDVGAIMSVIKGYFLRRYVLENNILPEVHELFATDDTDPQLLSMIEKHEATSHGIGQIVKAITKSSISKVKTGDSESSDNAEY